jgi:hypothetical protein
MGITITLRINQVNQMFQAGLEAIMRSIKQDKKFHNLNERNAVI